MTASGATEISAVPKAVGDMAPADTIANGLSHACAILADRSIACWGLNSSGQLGNGTTVDSASPVVAANIGGASGVAAGAAHTCALLAGGTVRCWGLNRVHQLGDGGSAASLNSVEVVGVSGATAITSGGWLHTCALLAEGTVKCWGNNEAAQLGAGDIEVHTEPVPVAGISTAVAVAAGIAHTCAVLSTGTVKCWGLGFGMPPAWKSLAPEPVAGISTAVTVVAGRNHSCALLRDGSVVCWGSNVLGALGNKEFDGKASYAAVAVVGL